MSSRVSVRSSQIKRNKLAPKTKKYEYKIETSSIQTIKNDELNKFCKVFKFNQ